MPDPLISGSDAAWDSEIELLAQTLPTHLYQALHERIDPTQLLEIVLDLGREPEARVPGRGARGGGGGRGGGRRGRGAGGGGGGGPGARSGSR